MRLLRLLLALSALGTGAAPVRQPLADGKLLPQSGFDYTAVPQTGTQLENGSFSNDVDGCDLYCKDNYLIFDDSNGISNQLWGFSWLATGGGSCKCYVGATQTMGLVDTTGSFPADFGETYCYSCVSTDPSSQPSSQPSSVPSSIPSGRPSAQPSSSPSEEPSSIPSEHPSGQPSSSPSEEPSSIPSEHPSEEPSSIPSEHPSAQPSSIPSEEPSSIPSEHPSGQPSSSPSEDPSGAPSEHPSEQPSSIPSEHPSGQPSSNPSEQPSNLPSEHPSGQPSSNPSEQPSNLPSEHPSGQPSSVPSEHPSGQPSEHPSEQPSSIPSEHPSGQPSSSPSEQPSNLPSEHPSGQPSSVPSEQPSGAPSEHPSGQPSSIPSEQPSGQPSSHPSGQPSSIPSEQPSGQPSSRPSEQPSSIPSEQPSGQPSSIPSGQPSGAPSEQPSGQPSSSPSEQPSSQPSISPSTNPSQGCENTRTDCGWGIFNPWTCRCDCPVGICLDYNLQCYHPCRETINRNPWAGCSPGWDCPWYPSREDGHCLSEMHQPNNFEIYRTAKECCDEHYGGSAECLRDSKDSHDPFPWPIHFPGSVEHRGYHPPEAEDHWGTEVSHSEHWFPDMINKLNCVYGSNYENWMTMEGFGEHYLFSNSENCCEKWYPSKGSRCPDMSHAVNPEAEDESYMYGSLRNYYFPDYAVNNCGYGIDYPAWMAINGFEKHYLFQTGGECCTRYFPGASNCPAEDAATAASQGGYYWNSYQDHLGNGEPMPVVYNHTYYPDLHSGTCVNGTDYPDWMGSDVDFKRMYLFSTLEGCCMHWYTKAGLDGCVALVIQGLYKVEPCPENRPECNHGPTIMNMTEHQKTKWYPDMDGYRCKNDGAMPQWMLAEGYDVHYLFNTKNQCCAAFGYC